MQEYIDSLVAEEKEQQILEASRQLNYAVARASWFRKSAQEGNSVLWIASTDNGYATRNVNEEFVRTWGPVIMSADQLWLGIDERSVIQLWQPGTFY
ncbi:MAG: hypothetical protein QM391_06640 [Bacillota bacterium]|jgi:hypothetical protein|nr:hypothetical protein [Bacillota bacterium]MDI9415714.1 hypothetical protein [Bacillota bacterium]NLD12300.1 hypothetical protein [Bacillota bacterium]HOB88366.1 hypothetical protein [Bacillota bacterium]HOJ57552.1 hypothetical protein [Bacillota bacterium]